MSIDSAVEQQIRKFIDVMPALTPTAKQAHRICDSRAAGACDLYRIISMDPILFCQTQSIFHYYRPETSRNFNSIARIIVILNIHTIKNYILRFAAATQTALDLNNIKKNVIDAQNEFFQHALASAIAARQIAVNLQLDSSLYELYYAAGLLHDVGEYFNIAEVDHSTVGVFVAASIGLPAPICDVISYHHEITRYTGEHSRLVYTAALADYIAQSYLKLPFDKAIRMSSGGQALDALGVTKEFCAEVADKVQLELTKAFAFIKAAS